MVQVSLKNITKTFGDKKALNNMSLDICDKEFLVLFGPAGAGKTTLLKVIAGLIKPDEGDILFAGKPINHVQPRKRNVSMVFENYALYPHLSVYENIASPLRSKLYKKSDAEIDEAVHNITQTMHINHLLERKPYALSNGQRQRVALGRSLVRNPNIFLLDEPLAHLDAKLRHLMRAELKEIQSQFDTTSLYVTHDYVEALSLGDRIAIMKEGEIIQISDSKTLYYYPNNLYIATLIGEPEINVLPLVFNENRFMLPSLTQDISIDCKQTEKKLLDYHHHEFLAAIRAHDILHEKTKFSENAMEVDITFLEPIGNKTILTVSHQDVEIRLTVDNDISYKIGEKIFISLPPEKMLFFDAQTENFIARSAPKMQKGGN